jgi:uncharacterized protein YacL
MRYCPGDKIEVIVDREGLGVDEGVGHLPDETMVVVVGAGNRIGESVQATIMSVHESRLGQSVVANVNA